MATNSIKNFKFCNKRRILVGNKDKVNNDNNNNKDGYIFISPKTWFETNGTKIFHKICVRNVSGLWIFLLNEIFYGDNWNNGEAGAKRGTKNIEHKKSIITWCGILNFLNDI